MSLAAVLFFYGGLSLLLSLVLPARRTAAMAAGVILLASYFITTLARLDKGMEPVARFSPISYYQSGDAIEGLNGRWLAGLLAAALIMAALAWWCFERRDIRVAGEGGWRWPRRHRHRMRQAVTGSQAEASRHPSDRRAIRSLPTLNHLSRSWEG